MITEKIITETCCGCGSCKNTCPLNCIHMKQGGEGFLYPVVDLDKCIRCNKCDSACPIVNADISSHLVENAYAGYCVDELVLERSSSGGMFFTLAEAVISSGGVVFGAALTDNNGVRHILAQSIDELKKLQGAKYVQSDINNCFAAARKELEKARWVLFSGTACQIAGLRAFLQRDYERLITIDVICHGVLSPLIWKKYVSEIERKAGSCVTSVEFRNKTYGWHNYSLGIKLSNGSKSIIKRNDSVFYTIYGTNLGLRLSCYDCLFKDMNRNSDITLGDFWGIEKVIPELDNTMGCSCIITHSEKGEELFRLISDKLVYRKVPMTYIKSFNPSYAESAKRSDARGVFWKDISEGMTIEKLAKKYDKTDWKLKLKRKIKKCASNIDIKCLFYKD